MIIESTDFVRAAYLDPWKCDTAYSYDVCMINTLMLEIDYSV